MATSELWKITSDGLSLDALEQLRHAVEQRLNKPMSRKATSSSSSSLSDSVGASCFAPVEKNPTLLCAIRSGYICVFNTMHGGKNFLFLQQQQQSTPTTATTSAKAPPPAAATAESSKDATKAANNNNNSSTNVDEKQGKLMQMQQLPPPPGKVVQSSSSTSNNNKTNSLTAAASSTAAADKKSTPTTPAAETQQQRILRKRSEQTGIAARAAADASVVPAATVSSRVPPSNKQDDATKLIIAAVLGSGLYIFDYEVSAKAGDGSFKEKPPAVAELPYKSDSTWYKTCTLQFAPPATGAGTEARLLVSLQDAEDPSTVVVAVFHRAGGQKGGAFTNLVPWTTLTSAKSNVPVGFVDSNNFLMAQSDSLVLYSIQSSTSHSSSSNTASPTRASASSEGGGLKKAAAALVAVGSVCAGAAISHATLLRTSGEKDAIFLLLVFEKTIAQSCMLSITQAAGSSRKRGRQEHPGEALDSSAVTMEEQQHQQLSLTMLNSFPTYEVSVQDVFLQIACPTAASTSSTVLAFLALETGAVAVLEVRSMKLVRHIAYRRLVPSSRLRLNVHGNSQILAIVEDDNVTTYKSC